MNPFFPIRSHISLIIPLVRSFSGNVSPKLHTFKIYRYNPETDDKPFIKSYTIDLNHCGNKILDALFKIKNEQDSSLTFRRSCREGICGNCGMNINGKNGLACITPINVDSKVDNLYPLPHLPVLKDLVVDMNHIFKQYNSIQPFLIPKTLKDNPSLEYLQTIEERALLDGLYECILCGCCTTSCPSYWWNGDLYFGPMTLQQSYRWIIDSRDKAKDERIQFLLSGHPDRFFRCHTIYNCSLCCPKNLNPAQTIAKLKKQIHHHFVNKRQNNAIQSSV